MREEFRVVVFCDQQAHFSDGDNLQQELKRQCTPIAMGLPVVLWVEQDNPVFQEAFQLCKKKRRPILFRGVSKASPGGRKREAAGGGSAGPGGRGGFDFGCVCGGAFFRGRPGRAETAAYGFAGAAALVGNGHSICSPCGRSSCFLKRAVCAEHGNQASFFVFSGI